MSGLGGGKKIKTPPPVAPIATPQELDKQAMVKADDRRRRMLAAMGRQGTILAGGLQTGKADLLGQTI